jgi:pilus assembly protein CpaB
MNARGLILIIVALVIAGGTAMLAKSWLGNNAATTAGQTQPVKKATRVLVASKNLTIGHIIVAEDLIWQSWPDDNINDSYIVEGKGKIDELPGRVVRHGLIIGEPITTGRLVQAGERGFVAAFLKPGLRAVTIPVNRAAGLGGLVFPGDRVDIILTHEIIDESGVLRQASENVIQNARVLAVDMRTDDQGTTPELGKSVTIEVTPKMVEQLGVVQRLGTLSLSLRGLTAPDGKGQTAVNHDDDLPTSAMSTYTLDAEVSKLIPKSDAKKGRATVSVTRGGEVSTKEFKGNK